MPDKAQTVNFQPAQGYLIGRPISREELNQSTSSLAMPDNVGKVKDSVGIAEVLMVSAQLDDDKRKLDISVGDMVAYIPFTDAVIEIGKSKQSIIAYANVMGISKAGGKQ